MLAGARRLTRRLSPQARERNSSHPSARQPKVPGGNGDENGAYGNQDTTLHEALSWRESGIMHERWPNESEHAER